MGVTMLKKIIMIVAVIAIVAMTCTTVASAQTTQLVSIRHMMCGAYAGNNYVQNVSACNNGPNTGPPYSPMEYGNCTDDASAGLSRDYALCMHGMVQPFAAEQPLAPVQMYRYNREARRTDRS
jgi:hypothetical protein